MTKHTYQLIINHSKSVPKPIMSSFGNNHRIEIHIRSTGIQIVAFSSAQKDPAGILYGEDALFSDALKKALLLYAVQYNHFLVISTASVLVDGESLAEYSMKEIGTPLVYSLSEGKLRSSFSSAWIIPGIKSAIASTCSSSYDGRFTALHALLAAKSDRYEIERFTYYWMAMNGLYNYIATEGEVLLKKYGAKELLGKEYRKLGFLDRCYGFEPFRPSGKNDDEINIHERRILWHLLPVIRSIPAEDIDEFCFACISSDESNKYIQQVLSAVRRMNDKYGYQEQYPVFPLLVVWLPYKIRCSSFHGERALPTFCYRDDNLLRSLRVINRILDIFLTEQLPLWLNSDESAVADRNNRLKNAALNPAYKTKNTSL